MPVNYFNNCVECQSSSLVDYKTIGDEPGTQGGDLPNAPTLLVCTNKIRIEAAIASGANIMIIKRTDGNDVGSPTAPTASCERWNSPEAGADWPSVSVQQIIKNLPKETMLLRNEFIEGRQTIEVGFTSPVIQSDPVLMDITVGPYRFKRKTGASIPLGMTSTIYSAQTYEIVK